MRATSSYHIDERKKKDSLKTSTNYHYNRRHFRIETFLCMVKQEIHEVIQITLKRGLKLRFHFKLLPLFGQTFILSKYL